MASIQKLSNGERRARYRDASGREHARHFDRKIDAQRWLDEVTASIVTGQYVDPTAGRITFREYAELWRAAQVHRPNSQAHVETMLRRHAYPDLSATGRWPRSCPATCSCGCAGSVTGESTAGIWLRRR